MRNLAYKSGLRLLALQASLALACCTASMACPEFQITEVAPGTFVHQGPYQIAAPSNGGGIANLAFIIGDKGVAAVDTGGSLCEGQSLRAAIRSKTGKPVLYAINTHMHPDHVLGNAAFKGEATFVGHFKLPRALAARGEFYMEKARQTLGVEAMAGTEVVAPTLLVENEMDLDLGGRIIHLKAYPTAHTDNDLTVFDNRTGTLFTGDLLFVRHTPSLDGSLKGWLPVIQSLKKLEAVRAVPGHGPPSVAWPKALEMQEIYLTRLRDDVRVAIKSGKTIGEAAKSIGVSERDAWELFDEYNARNVSAAYAELEWE